MFFLLSIGLFLAYTITGRAALGLLRMRFGHVRTWLLAPSVGLAVQALLLMIPNQAGVPVIAYARGLALATVAGAVTILVWRRLTLTRQLLPFVLVLVVAFAFGAWPAFRYGLNWIGYGNDDMTNYCLGAQRFLNHGFYDTPTQAELGGTDYSQLYWMVHVASLMRFGSEQMIAYVSGATGLKSVHVFMPLILSFGLVLLCAMMGLAYSRPSRRTVALGAGIMLATAPLWHCGTMYQLIAQFAGLALLTASALLTYRHRFPRQFASRLHYATLCALLISGMAVFYPEVLPFWVLGWLIHAAIRVLQVRRGSPGLLPTVLLAVGMTAVVLRHNLLGSIITLIVQAHAGIDVIAEATRVPLFPYFLMPSGPAFLAGFDIIVAQYKEPYGTIGLVAGFLALPLVALCCWRGLRARTPSAAMVAAMIVVCVQLFNSQNGFGLFKLAMFALPFLAVEIAGGLALIRSRILFGLVATVLAACWITGSVGYLRASLTQTASVAGELYDASESRGLLPPSGHALWSVTASSPVSKLLMIETTGKPTAFLSQIVGAPMMGRSEKPYPDWVWPLIPGEADGQTGKRLLYGIKNGIFQPERALGLRFSSRVSTEGIPPASTVVISSRAEERSYNKLRPDAFPASPGLFTYTPLDRLKNHLVFIQSEPGQHYYLGDIGQIAVYKPQADSYDPRGYFFVIGRYLLFRILNPSEQVRLRFNLTTSVMGKGRTGLPVNAVVRDHTGRHQSLGLTGAGSANVFSAPLQPFWLNGVPYIALDLGRQPMPIGVPNDGLKGLYHRNLTIDTRVGVGYCRDISLVDEKQYAAWDRPRAVASFPADLIGPGAVEYSGLYEDGWVSDHAFVVLGAATAGEQVAIKGLLPNIPGVPVVPQTVEVLIDGETVARQEITPGEFIVSAPIKSPRPATRIELRFTHTLPLPSPDNRPVSVLLKSIRLQSAP